MYRPVITAAKEKMGRPNRGAFPYCQIDAKFHKKGIEIYIAFVYNGSMIVVLCAMQQRKGRPSRKESNDHHVHCKRHSQYLSAGPQRQR